MLSFAKLIVCSFMLLSFSTLFANPTVVLQISTGKISNTVGEVEIEVFEDKTPVTAKNFINYVKSGYYDGTIFHRVISNFMIQGGGFEVDGNIPKQKPTKKSIKNEAEVGVKAGARNKTGYVAMARTSDPHSATTQFFINVKDNENLDHPSFDGWGYTVFGKVTKGMELIEKLKAMPTGMGDLKMRMPSGEYKLSKAPDVPKETIFIKSAKLKKNNTQPTPKEPSAKDKKKNSGKK